MQPDETMALNGRLSYDYGHEILYLFPQHVMAEEDQLESQKQLLLDEG
jgi:hypothetical protein